LALFHEQQFSGASREVYGTCGDLREVVVEGAIPQCHRTVHFGVDRTGPIVRPIARENAIANVEAG
jgi:hypothetical protein